MQSNRLFAYTLISFVIIGCSTNDERKLTFDLSNEKGNSYLCNFLELHYINWLNQCRADTTELIAVLKIEASSGNQNNIKVIFKKLENKWTTLNRPRTIRWKTTNADNYYLNAIQDSIYAKIRDEQVTLSINAKGLVERVNGTEKIIDSIAKELKESTTLVRLMLHDYISEEAIKDRFNRIFSTIPNKAVKIGENWGGDFTLIAKAPVHVNSLYTLRQVNVDSAHIDIQSTLLAGTAGNFYLNGTQSGSVILNLPSGLPILFESKVNSTTKTSEYDMNDSTHWQVQLQKVKQQ